MPLELSKLQAVLGLGDQAAKVEALKKLIEPLTQSSQAPDVAAVKTFANFVVDEIGEHDTLVSKPVLQYLVERLEAVDEDYNAPLMEICRELVNLIRPKYTYFCQALVTVMNILVELHQAEDEFRDAARLLASLDTEDQYVAATLDLPARVEWRIRTAQFFLEDGDNGSATSHIQKSRRLLRDLQDSHPKKQQLDLLHKTCFSRILDSERKFLAAAVNYLQLSQVLSAMGDQVQEADILQSLENAVTTAILAPAGPPRSRVLAMLYQDDRTRTLKNFKVLEKMHKNRILLQKEQDDFSKTLADHHQATLAGGLTVLQKAVYEHNMLAASIIYRNIKLEELGKLLGVSALQAEDLARKMIEEGRMKATIDQVDEIIQFDADESVLHLWDGNIQDTCMAINELVDQIDAKYPGKFDIP